MRHLSAKLTYANVMATIAVFIALGGGALAVGVARNSVGTKQLKANAVTSSKVKNGVIGSADVGSLNGSDIADGSLGPADVGGLGGGDIADGSLGAVDIANPVGTLVAPAGGLYDACYVTTGRFCGSDSTGWEQLPDESFFPPLRYYLDATGVVHIQGAARSHFSDTRGVFTLPLSLAPAGLGNNEEIVVPVQATNGMTTVSIGRYGGVGGDPEYILIFMNRNPVHNEVLFLAGISWPTE